MCTKPYKTKACLPVGRYFVALAMTCASSMAQAGESWPTFQNGGKSPSLEAVPESSPVIGQSIQWKASLPGYGQSSPIVWNGNVYVTSVEGDKKETYHILAFDLETGEKRWQHDVTNASPQENSTYVSRSAPTPAGDQDGLICFFEGGNLVALTHEGKVRWERNLVEEYGELKSRHGLSASVEQNEQAAFVWVERSESPYVLSVNKKTGETNWKVDGIGATSWASPRLVPVSDGEHLVLSAVGSLVGLAPKTGERLWKLEGVSGNSTPTPMPLGDGRFLIGATVGRDAGSSGKAAESNGVVAITKSETGEWKAEYAWRAKRATSSFGSPVAYNGMAYFVNQSGVAFGLDLATGEEKFNERLTGSIWATPFGVGNAVWFFGKDGKIDMLTTKGEEHNLTTWNELPEDAKPAEAAPTEGADGRRRGSSSGSVLYAATLCGDQLLLRRGDSLFSVQAITGGN